MPLWDKAHTKGTIVVMRKTFDNLKEVAKGDTLVLTECPKGGAYFHCPGCKTIHRVNVSQVGQEGTWGWNGKKDRPTLTPSVLSYGGKSVPRCHSFVKEGRIQFLEDSDHELKGQIVNLIPFCEASGIDFENKVNEENI